MLFISKSIFGLLREWAKPTNCPNYIWHWLETLSIHRLNEEKCIQLLCAFENFFRQRRRIGNTKSAWEAALLMLATNICIKPAKRFLHFLYHKCQYSRKSPCTNSTTLGLKGWLFLVNPYFFFFWEISKDKQPHSTWSCTELHWEINTRTVWHVTLPRKRPSSLCSILSSLYLQGVMFPEH